jgi:protein involved in polysaccharide export with SLBB domain
MIKNKNIKSIKWFFLVLGISWMLFLNPLQITAQNNTSNLEKVNQNKEDTQTVSNQQLRSSIGLYENRKSPAEIAEDLKISELERKIFGYKIFHNKNVKFEPNLNMATPKGYIVGPKDELALQVFGVAQSKYNVTVSNEGKISIPDIGVFQIGGLTIEAVKSMLTQKMALRYSGMQGNSPNTFLQVALSNIRTIKVNMVGEISVPGTYSLPSYVNVFNALFAAGGPTIKGSFRAVQVYRNNIQVAEIDLYDFIVNGKISQNIRLEDNDVILVRPSSNTIVVNGEFRMPGIFEMKPKETLKDLLKYVGGFAENAYKELVTIQRKGITEKQILDIKASQFSSVSLFDGDVVSANPILDKISNRVIISGAILRPGQYEWVKGMRIKDLVQKAGGFKGEAFLKNVILFRTKNDFTQEVISLDLTKISPTDTINNILLQEEDALSVKSIIDLREEYYVQISGEINSAGAYSYIDNMSAYDLILLAEGPKFSTFGTYIEIARRNINEPGKVVEIISMNSKTSLLNSDSLKQFYLKPFDHLFIRKSPGFQKPIQVTIAGEVLHPGEYLADKKEMRISDLVNRSGGFTNYAYLSGATLLRRTKSFVTMLASEKENQNFISIKQNINKDNLIANLETNKLLNKRLDTKITQNNSSLEEELKVVSNEKTKALIVNDNVKDGEKNVGIKEPEKPQELVAIEMNKILSMPGSPDDLILKDGDVLNIPELLQTVSIKGGVLFPVSVKFENNLSLVDYVNRAGGYIRTADRKKAYIVQANGKVEVVKNFLFIKKYPKVLAGAEVFIPVDDTERKSFSFERVTSILTTSLTLIFLLRTL